jgi:hypothetical protein
MPWNQFAAEWINQFHHVWLTPLLRARERFNATEAFVVLLGMTNQMRGRFANFF